jgi:hypothetical protein
METFLYRRRKERQRKMKTLLLASSLALAAIGSVSVAAADSVSIGVNLGRPSHYWWHNRWYDRQPVGYVYSAPPYSYDDPYWRYVIAHPIIGSG